MENIGTYFFFALVIGFVLYLVLKNKKITHPTADEERVFNPAAPSNPKLKKVPNITGAATDSSLPTGIPKTKETVEPVKLDEPGILAKTSVASSQFDLENEVSNCRRAQDGITTPPRPIACNQRSTIKKLLNLPASKIINESN